MREPEVIVRRRRPKRSTGRPHKPPTHAASELVSARLTPAERGTLARVLEVRKAAGMPGGGTFAGWLRAVLAEQAVARGIDEAEAARLARYVRELMTAK